MHDIRYAARVLRSNPGFTVAGVLTLALGIGLNTTVFSIFDAIALRPVVLPDGGSAVALYEAVRGVDHPVHGRDNMFSLAEYAEYRDHANAFSGLAAYVPEIGAMLDEPVRGQLASCNYFSALRVSLAMGRAFSESDCAVPDGRAVVVLANDTWRRHFDADPHIVGKQIKLSRIPFTVIGVAPPGFAGTELVRPAFWAPLTMQRALMADTMTAFVSRPDLRWLALVGRVRDRVTIAQARSQLGVIASRIDAGEHGRSTTLAVEEAKLIGGDSGRPMVAVGSAFLIAVGLVLLVACANLANLFLARAITRQREIAVRLAIGASRSRIVRQLFAESALIAIAGGALGTALAIWSAGALVHFAAADPGSTPINLSVALDLRIFTYSLGLVTFAAIGFGLVPAIQATRPILNRVLTADEGDPVAGRRWLRHGIVGGQVATCMVLLIAAGLFLRGLNHAQTVHPGWAMDGTTLVSFDLARDGYTPARAAAFLRDLDARLRALPRVDAVAEGSTTPLAGSHHLMPFALAGEPHASLIEVARVSPSYFAATRMPLVRGSDFNVGDVDGRRHVAIVNEAAARRFWPGQDPTDKTIISGNTSYHVAGVVRDAEVASLGRPHQPYIYLGAGPADALQVRAVIIHSTAPFSAIAAAARTAALSLDRDLHVKVSPMRDNLKPYIQVSELLGLLSMILGALALTLSCIGIWGTVAFTVTRRTREFGIRIALGARANEVTLLAVRQTLRPVIVGVLAGTLLAAAVTRVLAPVLFGVSSYDLVAFSGVPIILLCVAAAASYLPARRAAAVDPMVALRRIG